MNTNNNVKSKLLTLNPSSGVDLGHEGEWVFVPCEVPSKDSKGLELPRGADYKHNKIEYENLS